MQTVSFADISIVSCGTMSLELNYLKREGLLDSPQILVHDPGTAPGYPRVGKAAAEPDHQGQGDDRKGCRHLRRQVLLCQCGCATRLMQTIIEEQGPSVARIDATHCMDMIAGEQDRDRIAQEVAGGEPVWWMTPGWIKFRKEVFKGWDKGLANENFPRHTGGAVILDGVGYMDRYMAEKPEEFLEYADWMGIPIIPYPVTLDRFLSKLNSAAIELR
jgi:hypothetical protein